MNRRRAALFSTISGLWLASAAPAVSAGTPAEERLPNIVVIFTDDQGYADVGVFGAKGFRTPNLDRLAREGRRFTNFHVAQAVCSASRAALLTGCYSNRIGIHGALGPGSRVGISASEMTLAEVVKQRGYSTAIFGKWHLGDLPPFLPTRHGFDEYFGLPFSNDMWPYHPTAKSFPPLPLVEGEKIVGYNPDQRNLTTWYTERAVRFIERNRDRPFFLYVPHNMPHVPLYVSGKFRGKSERGLYGDVIMEIDWSVGRIMDALERSGIAESTLMIYASDNGPWLSYGDHGGSAFPLREGKGTSWEGGVRSPCIMRWPGRIPAGTICSEPAMTIDILPTVAKLVGAELPEHRIDGRDIWPLISGEPGAKSPQEAYFIYYQRGALEAVISGRWKLYFPHTYRTLAGRRGGTGGIPVAYESARVGLELYDLESDISETKDLARLHPEVVERLERLAEGAREDLGDALTKRRGSGLREPGRVEQRS
ncbi:MAG: sulfatase [Planctomycetes bacterium]|nr:sulfatase [Planctomycetota bacterium]